MDSPTLQTLQDPILPDALGLLSRRRFSKPQPNRCFGIRAQPAAGLSVEVNQEIRMRVRGGHAVKECQRLGPVRTRGGDRIASLRLLRVRYAWVVEDDAFLGVGEGSRESLYGSEESFGDSCNKVQSGFRWRSIGFQYRVNCNWRRRSSCRGWRPRRATSARTACAHSAYRCPPCRRLNPPGLIRW